MLGLEAEMVEKSAAVKLGLRPGEGLTVLRPVAGWQAMLGVLPDGARVVEAGGDVVLMFSADRADLLAGLPGFVALYRPGVRLWLGYAKLTSALAGDLSRGVIHDLVPGYGLDVVAQVALDADWSAMRVKVLG